MNLRQLFSQQISFNPKEKLDSNYIKNINQHFKRYINLLETNKKYLLSGIQSSYQDNAHLFINDIKLFCASILTSVDYVYRHHPSKSYKNLEQSIRTVLKHSAIKSRIISRGYTFYRIRESNDHIEMPIDLFHIPFNLRHIVSEQRFSLNGCPSLYIGNSIFTAWKECGCPDPSNVNIIKLKTTIPLEFLDLRFDIYNDSDISEYSDAEIIYFTLMYPLILSTNQVKSYKGAKFNAEYILSKKITELVKDKYMFDGIMYSSSKTIIQDTSLINYVIPTKQSNKYDGHCSLLKMIFEVTDVIKWNEIQMKGLSSHILNKTTPVNKEVNSILLDSSNPIPYNNSSFGELEIHMELNMPTKKVY